MKKLGSALFEQAAGTVFTADRAQIKITSKLTSLLQVSSCFGNHKASLLLAMIHLSGLGNSVNQKLVESTLSYILPLLVMMIDNIEPYVFQGHVYSLIGASSDNRFALMHAGYKHAQGIDGFPKDMDMAYSYYSNAGAQTDIDNYKLYENKVCIHSYRITFHIHTDTDSDCNTKDGTNSCSGTYIGKPRHSIYLG